MNQVAKAFVVGNFAVSTLFLGIAVIIFSTHVNFRELESKINTEYQAVKNQADEIEKKRAVYDDSVKEANARLKREESANSKQSDSLKQQAADLTAEIKRTNDEIRKTQEAIAAANAEQNKRVKKVKELTQSLATADDDNNKLFADETEEKNQLAQETNILATVEFRAAQMEKRLEELRSLKGRK